MFSHTKRTVSYCSFVPSSDFLFVMAVNGDSDSDGDGGDSGDGDGGGEWRL